MRDKAKRTGGTTARKFHPTNQELPKEKMEINILNLNDHCFERIFTCLNDTELLSVIRANTRFKLPCEQVFKRKYCREILTVSNLRGTCLKHSIDMLEHFGHLISKLRIRFKLEKIESLLTAVTANCEGKIYEMEIRHLGSRAVTSSVWYATGLEKIRSVLSNLSNHFPKIYHLKFDYCNTSRMCPCPYSDAVIQSIPTLKSFATTEASAGQIFPMKSLKTFFWLNRQLENVSLQMEVNELDDTHHSWFISQGFIQYLDNTLPLLKCVEINRVSTLGIQESSVYPVGFTNLKELTFYCFLEFQNVDRGFMSFLSESVEVLKLSTFDFDIANFLKNVTRFKQLKILELEYPLELASRLLNGDQKDSAVWSPNGIRQLILGCNRLSTIVVRQNPSEVAEKWIDDAYRFDLKYRDIIKDKLNGSQWKMYGDPNCFSFRKMIKN